MPYATTLVLLATAFAQEGARLATPVPSVTAAREAIRQAHRAVEGDSVARVRGRWLRAAGSPESRQLAALGLATLARLTYAYPEADSRYAELERSAGGSNPVVLYALLGRAHSHATRWQTDSANALLQRTLQKARALRDVTAEAEALVLLARIHSRSAGADSALRLLSRAESIVPRNEAALLADLRCVQGRLVAVRNAARGDSISDAAVRLAATSGDRRVHGRCLLLRAAVLETKGTPARAVAAAKEGMEIVQRARDLDALASALQFLAYLNVTYDSNFPDARRFADSAIATGLRVGNPLPVAWAQLNLAQVALRFGDFRGTARYTEAATRLFNQLGDRSGLGNALFLRGDAAYLAGRLPDARTAYQTADSVMTAIGYTGARVPALLRGAGVARELGRIDEAERAVNEAVRIADASGFIGISHTDQHYERGMIALARADYGTAIRELQEFRRGVGDAADHLHYDAKVRIAEALAGMSRLDAADSLMREVERTAEALRHDLTDRAARIVLLDGRRFDYDTDLGFATIVHRFAAAGRTAAAFRIAEARRARNLWTTMLRRHALRDVSLTGPELRAARLLPDEVQAARLAAGLPDSTALLEYVTGRGGEPSTLFVVTREGITAHLLPPADSLLATIASFVSALESGAPARGVARRLGATLLGPAQAALTADVKRLVIIPDGPLYRLPFDALELANGRPALERYAISVAPSARIPVAAWAVPTYSRGTRVLAFGDPAFSRTSGLPRLPATAREVRTIVAGIPNARTLLGERATEAALTQTDLRDVRVLHLATHAEVEDFGLLRSALSLAPGDGEDGRVGVEDIAALDLDADLVVLSGCRTAGGVIVNGEGIQGLVGPFLEAGARAVVATQWPVGDRSIVPLMTRFYRELRAGRSAGDALHTAKLASRAAGEPASVWASAVIAGDARVRPFARRVTPAR